MSMNEYDELFDAYAHMPYSMLVDMAKMNMNLFIPELKNLLGVEAAGQFILAAICAGIGVNGRKTASEHRLMNDVIGTEDSYENFCELTGVMPVSQAIDIVDEMTDQLSPDGSAGLLSFCLCFAVADGPLSQAEKNFMIRLFE